MLGNKAKRKAEIKRELEEVRKELEAIKKAIAQEYVRALMISVLDDNTAVGYIYPTTFSIAISSSYTHPC